MSLSIQEQKKLLGEEAVKRYVHSNMSIGLGSGSTAIWAIRYIANLYKSKELTNISCGVTGPGTKIEALKEDLPVFDLNAHVLQEFDVVIDGADEFDENLNLVKGGGGCLLQEKIVAYSAKKFIVVADLNKKVPYLGKTFPLPIEIIPSAYKRVETYLYSHYEIEHISLRMDARKVGPWITEEGNYIIDVKLGKEYNPLALELELVQIVGIVETGFFAGGLTGVTPKIMHCDAEGNIGVLE